MAGTDEEDDWIVLGSACVDGSLSYSRGLNGRALPQHSCVPAAQVEEDWLLIGSPSVDSNSGLQHGAVRRRGRVAETQVKAKVNEGRGLIKNHDARNATLQDARQASDAENEATAPSVDVPIDFVCISPTLPTMVRFFSRQNPRTTRTLLWIWFAVLLLGEAATAIWWFSSLGFRGMVLLGAPLGLGFAFVTLLTNLSTEQVAAAAVSLLLAAMPALPAYSVLLLMAPPEASHCSNSCWDKLHRPTLAMLGIMHVASALLPALRHEYPVPGSAVRAVLRTLEGLQLVARGMCVLAAWVYATVFIQMAAAYLSCQGRLVEPLAWIGRPVSVLAGNHGLGLSLHALGLLCAEARRRSTTALGDELLPLLVGARRAKALRWQVLLRSHGRALLRSFLRRVPALTCYVPPPVLLALIVAVRRTAPALIPALALLPWLARFVHPGIHVLTVLAGLALVALVCRVAIHEWRAMPKSAMQRLPLLLPSSVAPRMRALLGHALVVADRIEGTRQVWKTMRLGCMAPISGLLSWLR